MCERVIVVLFNLCLGFNMMKGPLRDHCYVFTDVYHCHEMTFILSRVRGCRLAFHWVVNG